MRNNPKSQGSLGMAMGVMLSVLVLVTLLFFWRTYSVIEANEQYQQQLADKQAKISARAIQTLTDSIRNRMIAVILDDFFYLDLGDLDENDAMQQQLQMRLKYYFPEMYSYSLLDTSGEIIGGNIDFSMGELCRLDARHVADRLRFKTSSDPFMSAIHPVPGAYHFDVMFPVLINKKSMVFFMSFHADVLHKALELQKVTSHPVFLVSRRFPNLIEVSYEGVIDQLKRPAKLTAEELSETVVRRSIPNTQWQILVQKNTAEMESFKQQKYLEALLIYGGFLVAWGIITWLLMRQEFRRKTWMSRLDFLSFHDPLTGASNRRRLEEVLNNASSRYKNEGIYSGILYLDLDNFKPINDRYGHVVGDEILKIFAKRLQACCRQFDEVSRLGGDEFVVVLMDLGHLEQEAYIHLTEAAHRCYKALENPIDVKKDTGEILSIPISASIGSLLLSHDDMSMDDILNKADELMYRAKSRDK